MPVPRQDIILRPRYTLYRSSLRGAARGSPACGRGLPMGDFLSRKVTKQDSAAGKKPLPLFWFSVMNLKIFLIVFHWGARCCDR